MRECVFIYRHGYVYIMHYIGMYRCMYISVYVYVCMVVSLYRICMCTWVYTYVSVCSGVCLACIYIYSYVRLHATVFRVRLERSGPVAGDPDSIRIRAVEDPIQ